MTAPRPQTIGDRLVTEAFHHLRQNSTPTDFEMRRMARDAGKLDAVSPIEGAMAFAAIAAIKWDTAEVEAQIERMLSIDRSPTALFNSALIFHTVNDSDRASELFREAWQKAPADATFQGGYFATLVRSGRLLDAHEFAGKVALQGEEKEEAATLARTVRTLEKAGLTQERIAGELAVTLRMMTDHRVRSQRSGFGTQLDPESGASSLVAIVDFVGDYDDETTLTAAMAERLIDMPGWNPAQFAIRLVPTPGAPDELLAA